MRFSLGVFFRLIVSIVLAYPLSGVVYWTFEIFKGLPGTLKSPGVDLFLLFFWIIEIPACGGFIPANGGDPYAQKQLPPSQEKRRCRDWRRAFVELALPGILFLVFNSVGRMSVC
jgi:hypothetical protein